MWRVVFLLFALLARPALAQDYDAGLAAFDAGDYASAAQEWATLAATGDGRALFNLRLMAENGLTLPVPAQAALGFYRTGAGKGVALSQINLALACLHGRGTQANAVTALMWLHIAGQTGNAEAQELAQNLATRLPYEEMQQALTRAANCQRKGLRTCLSP
jgi:uncharacterized protein